MPRLRTLIAVALTFPVGYFLYNFDAYMGQWKFEKLCKEEGGPRYFAPVEKGVGWEVDGKDNYEWVLALRDIAFVRYSDASSKRLDVRLEVGRNGRLEPVISAADETKSVRYRYQFSRQRLPEDARFGRDQHQIVDAKNGQILASYTEFGYQWTKPERVILAAPTGVGCWKEQAQREDFRLQVFSMGEKQ